ncbi:MAG: MraY family glycosyltransferase [Candidatus Sumerlaeota bacterium]|nr:MraY family glycosyltransferase [Candidatus Sumerlaeota bacterium]
MYAWIEIPAVTVVFFFCLALTAALTPLVMKFARRIGAVDTGGYRKIYEGAMPLLGGLGIALPIIVLTLGAALAGVTIIHGWKWVLATYPDALSPLMSLRQIRRELFLIAFGGAAVVALGIYDDKYGMRARYKLAGQMLIGLLVCAAGVTLREVDIPGIGRVTLPPVAGFIFTILWIAGLINAFNLIDGIDGLASGVAFIISGGLIVLGILTDSPLVILVCAALAGSSLAFLAYNFNPARIFLGDTGSMFLGYVLGTVTLLGTAKTQTATAVLAPILALGFPIYETLVSMARRLIRGQPIFAGDQHHTHHRLLRSWQDIYGPCRCERCRCGASAIWFWALSPVMRSRR